MDGEAFFLGERERVKEGLERGLSEAPLALVGPDLVELAHPEIEVGLEVVDRGVIGESLRITASGQATRVERPKGTSRPLSMKPRPD